MAREGHDGRSWPSSRDEYITWLAGRIEGYGNDAIEPIRSLVADGLVHLVDKPHSSPTRLTAAGRARADALLAATGPAA